MGEENIKPQAIKHIKRDMTELNLLLRVFEEQSNQRNLMMEAVNKLKEVLVMEGVKFDEIN